jgi:hypothetical protein
VCTQRALWHDEEGGKQRRHGSVNSVTRWKKVICINKESKYLLNLPTAGAMSGFAYHEEGSSLLSSTLMALI